MQNIFNRCGLKIGRSGHTAPIYEREAGPEGLKRAAYTIVADASQFNEIFRRRNGDQQTAVIAQHSPELGGVHPRRYRQNNRERGVGIRQESIRIGHNPLASWIAPSRGINSRN